MFSSNSPRTVSPVLVVGGDDLDSFVVGQWARFGHVPNEPESGEQYKNSIDGSIPSASISVQPHLPKILARY
jgi:hypothetical protein